MTGTPSGLSERTPTVDKTASTEIVARRIEVFKAALAEVGYRGIAEPDPDPRHPHVDPGLEQRRLQGDVPGYGTGLSGNACRQLQAVLLRVLGS